MTPPRHNVLSFFFLIFYLKMHSGERKDLTVAAVTMSCVTHGTYLDIIADLKGPSSCTEQTTFTTSSFNITHYIIPVTILLYLVVKILGKK